MMVDITPEMDASLHRALIASAEEFIPPMTNPTHDKPSDRVESVVREIVRGVSELPDYTSPEDEPDLLMCTVSELEGIAECCIDEALRDQQAEVETYRQMHATAKDLGYPSILEALEALADQQDGIAQRDSLIDELRLRAEQAEAQLAAMQAALEG
jgi:hypothetical protein